MISFGSSCEDFPINYAFCADDKSRLKGEDAMRFFFVKAIEWTILIFLVFPWLMNCTSFLERGKLDSFEQTSKHYRLAILMSNFEQAIHLSALDFPKDPAYLKNFHVVSYTPKKIEFSSDKSKAYQTVEIEYYRIDSMRQKIIRDIQEWNYKPKSEQWVLTSGLPKFK